MTGEVSASIEVEPGELGEALSAVRLCAPEAQQQMQRSLSRLGQLTPVQAYRVESRLETFDGLKRLRAARLLSWPKLRVEVHALDSVGAKVRLLLCNRAGGLSELEEAWLVRSLYRDDKLNQGQIARLRGRVDKSWVCRRLALAEDLSDGLTANVPAFTTNRPTEATHGSMLEGDSPAFSPDGGRSGSDAGRLPGH